MIFVLDPKVYTGTPNQQRPLDLGCNQRVGVNKSRGAMKVG